MPYAYPKTCLLALAITLSIGGYPLSAVAETLSGEQNATRFFDLPAAPLGVTLSRIARDSNLTLSVAPALLQGKTSAPVNGMYTPQQAAERALAGSGLGLLSVQAFAASCRARVSVARSPLGGAVFQLAIPVDQRPAARRSAAAPD